MRICLTVGLGLVSIGMLGVALGFTQPRMPQTETDLRATIAEQNIRLAESTQEFAENLRSGPVAVELKPTQSSLSSGWPALLERDLHPLEYTTLPSRTDPIDSANGALS